MKGSDDLTIIEIRATVDITLTNEDSPYYERTILTPHLSSTTKFERVVYSHLGFHAYSDGKRRIKRKGDLHTYIGMLEPNVHAQATIGPFRLCFENLGDGFMGVHIRMQDGIARCKMTVLQERHQPKQPKEVDTFIKFEEIWYATATINCLQTVRIEEMKGE
jgi:hypothetical protein